MKETDLPIGGIGMVLAPLGASEILRVDTFFSFSSGVFAGRVNSAAFPALRTGIIAVVITVSP